MSYLIKPEGYKPLLDLKQTELGIKHCRSQILTPLRYLFVTMPENATNGYE